MARDLRMSARVYRRRPLATGLAVIALAMAIGVATGVFSVLNGVMFRSLPFRDPGTAGAARMFNSALVTELRWSAKDWARPCPYLAGAAGSHGRDELDMPPGLRTLTWSRDLQ